MQSKSTLNLISLAGNVPENFQMIQRKKKRKHFSLEGVYLINIFWIATNNYLQCIKFHFLAISMISKSQFTCDVETFNILE